MYIKINFIVCKLDLWFEYYYYFRIHEIERSKRKILKATWNRMKRLDYDVLWDFMNKEIDIRERKWDSSWKRKYFLMKSSTCKSGVYEDRTKLRNVLKLFRIWTSFKSIALKRYTLVKWTWMSPIEIHGVV